MAGNNQDDMQCPTHVVIHTWGYSTIMTPYNQYKDIHDKAKMTSWPSCLDNGISYTWKHVFKQVPARMKHSTVFNSLWPNDAIWPYGSLMAPSHYLIRWWIIISGVMLHAPVSNFTESAPKFDLQHKMENYILLSHLLEANEFTCCSIASHLCHWSYEGHEYIMMKSHWKSFMFLGNVQQSMHIWPHRSGSILWADNIFKAKQSVTQNKLPAYFYHALCVIIKSE